MWHDLAHDHLSLGGEVGLRSNPGEGALPLAPAEGCMNKFLRKNLAGYAFL
jgi:hypothetical protein